MTFLKCIVFVCLTVLLTVKCDYRSKNRNLIAVVQLFRHGQRTPVVFYRNDPYSDKSFWDGLEVGELTNEGKRQHFALGQFTRNRYGDWLSDKYDKDDFYAYTTDVDRTHMSGQSNLNGLYPAKGDQRWKLFSDWQAIPLHPADGVIFNAIPDASCTNYYIQYANALAAEKYQQINENNADLYDYLSRHSGNNITSVSEASTIFDCFRSENDIHLRLPLWATSVFPDPLYKLTGFTFEQYSYTTQLQRLAVGPFFDNMVKYFEGLIKNSTSAQKYLMYSGHDSNIAAMLNSFDAFNPPYPPAFASSIYIELRSGPGLYYINVWSKNNNDFKPISVRGCTLNCPLSEFKERMKDIIIDVNTRNSECNPNGIENRNSFFTDSNAQEIYSDLVADNGIEKLIARF